MAEGTCPACGHPYRSDAPAPTPRTCVWCGATIPAAVAGDHAAPLAWRAAMTAGALAVLLAGAMVASIELFGPGRGTRLLMQGLTVLILVAALFSIWRRYRGPPGR